MKWITSGDIKNWVTSKQRHCQDTLPELVRRLILAHTGKTVDEFDFPCGDSVATSGWDGRLKTSVVSPFFPNGTSGWEIGTEKSAPSKAEGDYAKRLSDPLGFTATDTTFVFVTPRAWPGRAKWQAAKRLAKAWKDVRVISSDGLEQWLESSPAVALWLARQIGKVVSNGIRDLEAVWEEWAIGTKPTMTPTLVIGGRNKDVVAIQKWIAGEPRILEVQGDAPDEAVAFLYASIVALPETERVRALARCVVVENISELRQLTQAFQNYPLIIAAQGDCLKAAPAAVAKGHHVFISMDATVIGLRDILRLARPQRSVVEKILHESGLSEADSQRIARDSGHSITVLRRQLFQSNAVSAPSWANAKSAFTLIPVLFANAWDEQKDGDRHVIETLSGMGYEAFVKELTPFLSIDDSPIRKVGSVWMIKSPLDAWFLLAPHIIPDYLKHFEQALLGVLTKTDPKYELDAEKRWAAAIYGKANPYSEWLRTGLVESLVLLAVFGDRSSHIASTQTFADHVVKEVFNTADKWEAWASIKDATALLSEAAPDSFMDAVDQLLSRNPAVFQDLMRDDSGVFGECRHSGLLWALEGIAWSSQYFARAVNVLVKLANIDPGGKWSNRAISSLSHLFLPGFSQTHAKALERLESLKSIIAKEPKLAWKFSENYYSGGSLTESHRFRWRDTGGTRRGLEHEAGEEYQTYMRGLLPMLRDLACARENLIDSIGDFIRLPTETCEKLIATLKTTDPDVFSQEEREMLLQKTRAALNWINSYDKKNRRVHVPALNQLLVKFAPTDVLARVGWLLSSPCPRLPQGESKNYDANEKAVSKARESAAREVLDKVPVADIIKYAGTIPHPSVLGYSLAKVVHDKKEDTIVLDAIIEHVADIPALIRGYAHGRVSVDGAGWIDEQIKRIKIRGNYTAEVCAMLYFGLPEGASTWASISSHGKEVEAVYWKHSSGYSQINKNKDAPIAVEKLLDAKRPAAALQIAGEPHGCIPCALLQRLLQELVVMDEKDISIGVMEIYHLGHVFNQIYEKNELSLAEIATLEWPFAAIADDLKEHTSSPLALHRALQNDPQFFAQLVSFTYKRDDHAPDPARGDLTPEQSERRGRAARKILDSWYLIPGVNKEGVLNEEEFRNWVIAARKQCLETNHGIGCDLEIGFMLAHTPSDPNGEWPHIAVRNLIEQLNSETVDRHVQNEIFNSRGIVSRAPSDGGVQERKLAEKYRKMGDSLQGKWPRTAAMLRGIGDSYANYAKREDIDSDLHDFRCD